MLPIIEANNAWLCSNIKHFIPKEQNRSFELKLKALDELCLYAFLHRARDDSSIKALCYKIDTLLSEIPIGSWMAKYPEYGMAFVYPVLLLESNSAQSKTALSGQLIDILSAEKFLQKPRPVHRVMDVLFSLELLTKEDISKELATVCFHSLWNHPPSISSSLYDFYAFTHCCFFGSKFTYDGIAVSNAETIDLLIKAVIRFFSERNADIIAELGMCIFLAKIQDDYKVVVGKFIYSILRYISCENGRAVGPKLEERAMLSLKLGEREWFSTYHTALVLATFGYFFEDRMKAYDRRIDNQKTLNNMLDGLAGISLRELEDLGRSFKHSSKVVC